MRAPTKRMSRIATAVEGGLMLGQLQAMRTARPGPSAIILPEKQSAEERAAALVIPFKDATRELQRTLQAKFEHALLEACQAVIGRPVEKAEDVADMVTVPMQDPEGKDGDGIAVFLGERPVLWAAANIRKETHDGGDEVEVRWSRPVKRLFREIES